MKKEIFKLFIVVLYFFPLKIKSQNIDYYMLNCSSNELINSLNKNKNYLKNSNSYYPNNKYFKINIYNTTGVYVNIKFKNINLFHKTILMVQTNALFSNKFCTSYTMPVTFKFTTINGNIIRFNNDEMEIQIEYPSKVNSYMNSFTQFNTVFVCNSDKAYAYHTNIKCEGLHNCETNILETNSQNAVKKDYKICEICSTY